MFHTCAYTASNSAAAANADTPALTDGWATIQNNHFIFQQDLKLLAAYANGAAISDARINTPHFRMVGFPHVCPVDVAALPSSLPALCIWQPPYITIPHIDEVAMELSNAAGGAEREFALLWVGDGAMNIPQGDIYPLKFTAAITAVANQWTRGNITFESTLPAGTYSVVGMDVIGTTCVAARLRFQTYQMLPGCLGRATAATKPEKTFREGRLGEWGRFTNTAIPTLEILCTAADTAQTGFMDVIKIA